MGKKAKPDEPHVAAYKEGQRLAVYLSQEFDEKGIGWPVVLHSLCHIIAGYLLDADMNISVGEQLDGKLYTDDEKIQFMVDEIKELAAAGRMKRAEVMAEGKGRVTNGPDRPQ